VALSTKTGTKISVPSNTSQTCRARSTCTAARRR
jgi:hypothetical protein